MVQNGRIGREKTADVDDQPSPLKKKQKKPKKNKQKI
jgi:hypothetical protein